MSKSNKGIAPLIAIIAIVAIVLIGGGVAYYYYTTEVEPVVQTQQPQDQENLNTPSNEPSITVTSPNGGETWVAGSTHNITWNSTNLDSSASINIAFISGGNSVPIATVSNSGLYSWTLPFGNGATNLKISITSTTNTSIGDISDGVFTVAGAHQPSITVTSPNGGETWKIGETHDITWDYSGISEDTSVCIRLGDHNSGRLVASDIKCVPISDKSYLWIIPSIIHESTGDVSSNGNQWKIEMVYTFGGWDESDNYFSIVAP